MTLEELFKIHRMKMLFSRTPEPTLRCVLIEHPEVKFGQSCEI